MANIDILFQRTVKERDKNLKHNFHKKMSLQKKRASIKVSKNVIKNMYKQKTLIFEQLVE